MLCSTCSHSLHSSHSSNSSNSSHSSHSSNSSNSSHSLHSSYSSNSLTLNKRDEKYATYALYEANKSNMKHHQHGCVAVIGGKIIARGYNSDRTSSSDGFLKTTCSCHAEIDVMRKLEKLINKKWSSFKIRRRKQCFLWENKFIRCKKKHTTKPKCKL